MFFGADLRNIKSDIETKTARVEELKKAQAMLVNQLKIAKGDFANVAHHTFHQQLTQNIVEADEITATLPPYDKPGWEIADWTAYNPERPVLTAPFFFGEVVANNPQADGAFAMATGVNLIGQNLSYIIESNRDQNNEVYAFLQSLSLRIYARLLHHVNFTFIDPSGFGKAFPIAKQLNTRLDSGDLFRLLEDIGRDITRINQNYGLSDDRMFDSVAESTLINERFEVIIAANFPKDYDRRAIERLMKIADQGPIAGKYVIIHRNLDEELPRDIDLGNISNACTIFAKAANFSWKLPEGTDSIPLQWKLDDKPSDEVAEYVIRKIKDAIPQENPIDWPAIQPDSFWEENAIEYIQTTTGVSGRDSDLNIWFGRKHKEGSRQCVHGVVAGMPGSGKSNFYHALILGLAARYSPKEIALYLIDGKDGVEFQDYKYLPHAEFVSLKSLPGLSRSILKDLTEEIERRNELFREQHSVDNYENYRLKVKETAILPRILLIVDEYQELFEDDKLGEASACLRRISEEGRSAGVHMLLGSQRFGTVNMMHQSAIFGNIHMRIAMKLSLADRQALSEFGKEGKEFLANCDLPGKVVVNDQSGDDGYNKSGKVALIKKEDRQQTIRQIIALAESSDIPRALLTTNIFNGVEQPVLSDNPQFGYLLKNETTLSKKEMEDFAKKEVYHGGLGEISWFAGENPMVFWMGQEFNVRGHANIVTRRRQRENVLVIGDNNDARYGMLFGIVSSAVLNSESGGIRFYTIDKSIPGTPWNNILPKLHAEVVAKMKFAGELATSDTDALRIIHTLAGELAERKKLAQEDRQNLPSVIFLAADLDRIEQLNLQPNKFGSFEETEQGALLRQIFIEGPALGIHCFFSFEGVMQMYNVVNKKNVEFFRHRVALQMSEQDAFDLVRRRDANRLQVHGSKPIAAYYLDIGSSKATSFKPYIVSKGISEQLLDEITNR